MQIDRGEEFTQMAESAMTKMAIDEQRSEFENFFSQMLIFADESKSQLFQDLWAWWESGCKKEGYFVEFGAASGVKLSNTYMLEKIAGWKGILAEPHPKFQASIAAHRSCFKTDKCVFSSSGKKLKFLAVPYGELSRLADIDPDDSHEKKGKRQQASEVEVETISLADLLDLAEAPSEIDYMSVDTEGSEYEILSAFDFKSRRIRFISVEHNRTPARERIFTLLSSNGYRRKWEDFSRFDDWYVLDDGS